MWLFWGADPSSPRQLDGDVFVELDVGSEGNGDEAQLGGVLRDLLAGGSIASYLTSPHGFQFRRLGAGEPEGVFGGSLRGFWGALEQFGAAGLRAPHPNSCYSAGSHILACVDPWPNWGGGVFRGDPLTVCPLPGRSDPPATRLHRGGVLLWQRGVRGPGISLRPPARLPRRL